MSGNLIIKNAAQLVTCSGFKAKQGKEMSDLKVIDHGAVVIEAGLIKASGKTDDVLAGIDEDDARKKGFDIIDAAGKSV
ncbi:MAG: imidazolonepropionase, partial [Desulfobacteraceae bacterium]|nr:imidazolonepropionase [Desulfobacteraceae bacterium]